MSKYGTKSCYPRKHSTLLPIFCILSYSTSSYFFHKAPSKEGNRENCSWAGKNMVTCKSRITFPEFLWKKCDHHLKLYHNPSAEQGRSSFHGYQLYFCNFFAFPTREFTIADSQMLFLLHSHVEVSPFPRISVLQLNTEGTETFKLLHRKGKL